MQHLKNTNVVLALVLTINIMVLYFVIPRITCLKTVPCQNKIPHSKHISFYRMDKTEPCQCIQTFDTEITETIINLTTCSRNSAMTGKFHRKVISFSYYKKGVPDRYDRNFFKGIEKNLFAIKKNYGQGWSMRLYFELQRISTTERKKLCQMACMYPEEFNLCDIDNIPRFGNLSHIFPMNWRFLTMLDPQVDIALSRDLDSTAIQREMDAVNEFLNSSKLVHVMRDHPYHNVPILGGMWGIKLTPDMRFNMEQAFTDMFGSDIFYKNRDLRGPDQDLLGKYIWPWAKYFVMGHDSYFCKSYANSRPFPTKRKNESCNFVGCIGELSENETKIVFEKKNECPLNCRPNFHPEWTYC